jgi:hypothetical protein
MAFRELTEFLNSPRPELPVRGKVYVFPSNDEVSGRVTLQLRLIQSQAFAVAKAQEAGTTITLDRAALDEVDEARVRRELMTLNGHDVEAEMIEDGCSGAQIDHVLNTLVVWHTAGPDAAEQAWEAMAGRLDPPAPNRAQRRAGSSDSATTTKRPASTSGTRSPKALEPATARRGTKSSTPGA